MTRGWMLTAVTVGLALATLVIAAPQRAQATTRPPATVTRAVNIPAPVCTVAGWFSGLAGTLCSVARKGGELLGAGGKLLGGAGTVAKVVSVATILAGLAGWVTAAANAVLAETASVIGTSTRPALESSWFSASYWRMAEIGLLLTVPFLFAACVQGILRSDPSLIGRAALGYLPLAVLGITVAAPMTTLLLSASDGLSTLVADAAGQAPGAALAKLGVGTGALAGLSVSTFIAFVVGFITVAATLTLWVELLIRAAAVNVIVLMLPVVFAALVWPARRVWAIRSVETLVALILAKFAIVAVLSLGATAIDHGSIARPAAALVGVTLVMLAAFSPWALLRLLPLHEMATGVEGLGSHLSRRIPMPDGPSPRAPGDQPARPDAAVQDDEPVDAAQTMVARLNGDGRPDARAFAEEPANVAAVAARLEPGIGSDREEGSTQAADRVAEAVAGDGASEGVRERELADPSMAHGGTPIITDADATPVPRAIAGPPDEPERLPGMGPMWQRRNHSWPHVLGPEGVPPEPGPMPDTPEPGPMPESLGPPKPLETPLGPVDRPGLSDGPVGGER